MREAPLPRRRVGAGGRYLAATLCACLGLGGPGGPLCALTALADPPPTANSNSERAYLENVGLCNGPDDPLRSYLFDSNGRLTNFGQELYRYFSDFPKPAGQSGQQFEQEEMQRLAAQRAADPQAANAPPPPPPTGGGLV